ncbi:MAG: hypothetical protein JST19_03575 [Bacteroidetes bacterium]|nr:hypothetical protein [Bacteroidota bacterium]
MKRLFSAAFVILIACAFSKGKDLKGTWIYLGGIYNGKQEGAPTDYSLERKYKSDSFEAFGIEQDSKPEKYEAGIYQLKDDTCIETQTYSSQPSKLINIPVRYLYEIRNDSLILKGTLPTGMVVEEYWKREK